MTSDVDDFSEFMAKALGLAEAKASSSGFPDREVMADVLRGAWVDLTTNSPLAVGDIVEQKPGLAVYTHPAEGQVALVVKVLKPPLVPLLDPSRPSFNIPLDLAILVANRDGPAMEIHVDSRRFRRVAKPKV